MLRLVIFSLLSMMMSLPVMAACSNPAGDEGHVIFNTSVKNMQFCNGTDWVNTVKSEPAATQAGCSTPSGVAGEVVYISDTGMIQVCNGQNWMDTACVAERFTDGPGCENPSATAGTIMYASADKQLQFCDSTNWVVMGAPCGAGSYAAAEAVAYISSDANNVDIQTLFSGSDWADDRKRKRLVINAGVVVGSASATLPALQTGTARGGSLIIENHGTVAGAGGAANGGAGGHAIKMQQGDVVVQNSGNIYGGGGGGGKGGTGGKGGAGTYNYAAVTGPYYARTGTLYYWMANYNSAGRVIRLVWAGSTIYNVPGANDTLVTSQSIKIGSYTYRRGTRRQGNGSSGTSYWEISREIPAVGASTGGTGGVGGDGGLGQGFNQTNTAGATGTAGTAGGTNAGTGGSGGAGGAGGTWGQAGTAGSTGITGAAGNNGSGTAGLTGSAGGAAGAAITGGGYTITNTGTIRGSY